MDNKQYVVTIGGMSQTWDSDKYKRNAESLKEKYPDAIVQEVSAFGDQEQVRPEGSYLIGIGGQQEIWDGEKLNRNKAHLRQKYPDATIGTMSTIYAPEPIAHYSEASAQSSEAIAQSSAPQEELRGFRAGARESWKGLKAGTQFAYGEVSNALFGSSDNDANALYKLDEMLREGKDVNAEVGEAWTDAGRELRTGALEFLPSIGFRKFKERVRDEAEQQRVLDDIRDAIGEAGGDIAKAREILATRAQEKSYGDIQKEKAMEKFADVQETKGFGAWVGENAIQMIPSASALIVGALTKSPGAARAIGMIGMGGMTAATAGSSMHEARESGASDYETRKVGVVDGALEYITEKLPFDNYTNWMMGKAKGKVSASLAKALRSGNAPLRKELEDLLKAANKELGGKLFSKKNLSEYVADMIAEGASEFTAEASQTMTKLIYDNPDLFPLLGEAVSNGMQGALAGFFMGGILGGAATTMEHQQHKQRRKEQGHVDVGVVDFGDGQNEIVEILSVDEDTNRATVLHNGVVENVNKNAIGQSYRYSYEAFEAGRMKVEESEAIDNGTVTEGKLKASADRLNAATTSLTDALREAGKSEADILNAIESEQAQIFESDDLQKAYDEYRDARSRDSELNAAFGRQKETQRGVKRLDIEEAVGEQFWREIPTENEDGVTTWETIVTYATLQDGRKVYLFPGIDATETSGVTEDGRKIFVTPDMLVEGSEVTEPLDDYLDNLVNDDKKASEQERMSRQTVERTEEAKKAAQPGTQVNLGTAEEPVVGTIMQATSDGVIVQSEVGAMQMTWEEYANAMNIGSAALTDEETASFEASEILSAESQYKAQQATNVTDTEEALVEAMGATSQANAGYALPLKADGSVDQTTLWNNDPERWAQWNDEQRQDGGANSLAYINGAIVKEQARLAELTTAYSAESDFDARSALEAEIASAQERLSVLGNLQQRYAVPDAEMANVASDTAPETAVAEEPNKVTLALKELYNDPELSEQEIESYISANLAKAQSDLDKHLAKAPKMGTDMAKYKSERAKHQEKAAELEKQRDFWREMQSYVEIPSGSAVDMEPQNALEFTASELARKDGVKLQRDSFMRHTGYGSETGNFLSLLRTKKNGGLTLEEAGERLMEMDRENGTGFFDQTDPNAGLNAILEVLGGAKTSGDVSGYIKANREQMARESMAAARNAMAEELIQPEASADVVSELNEDLPEDIFPDVAPLDEDMPDFETRLRAERSNDGSSRYANVKERASAWAKRLGVKVRVAEDIGQVEDEAARDAIGRGEPVTGWFNTGTGEVWIYAPNIARVSEIDKTVIHEVISHKGLRGLLGRARFDALCDTVWNMMKPETRKRFLNYENVLSKARKAEYEANPETFEPNAKERRAAADEFIAKYSESVNTDKNAWQKMVGSAKRFINKITGKYSLGDQLDELIEASLARYEQIAKIELKGVVEEGATYKGVMDAETGAMINPSANEQAEGNTALRASDGTLVGMHNISEDKLRKAIKQGGLANPSTAVVNIAEYSLEGYGDISLIMPSSLVDSETGDNAGTYTGDAWTPTYPTISRQLDDAGWKLVKDRIRAAVGESDDLYHDIVNSVDNYLSDDRNSRLEFVFLKEKGIEPKIEMKGADGYVGLRNLEAILGIEGLRDSMESYEKYKAASPMAKRSFNMWQRVGGEKKAHKALKDEIRQYPQFAKLMGLDEDLTFAGFDSFTYSIFRKEYDAGNVNTIDTLGGASRYVDANDMRTEFEMWLESLMEEAGAKEVFFAGWTRDGDRIYKDNTLENVSRHMRMQGRTNAYNDHGLSATKSALLQRLTSLAEIRKNRARLQDESSYNKAYDKLKDRLFSVISQLADMEKISDNPFMNIDYAEARLQEAIVKRNPISYLNNEYGYSIDPKGEYAEELKSFIKDVQKMPAKYFETKFERPVYLNEFAAAVMPNNTSEDVKQALTEAGLPIFEYDSAVEGARREATLKATEEEGVRFRILGEMGAANLDAAEEATTRLDNLDVARQMEEAGKDAKTIRLATGWERGVDNLWRYEVPDEYDLANLEKRLQEELDNGAAKTWGIVYPSDLGQLLKEYPDFNVDIMVWVGDEFENTGAYSPATEGDENTFGRSASIEVEAKTIADVAPLLAHEIQHAIQEMEGFSEGGQARGLNDKLSAELDKRVATIKQLREEGRNEEADELMQMSKGLAEAVINNEDDAYGNYKKLAGEVEARNAAKRIGKSLQERRESLLSETEDVAREDQIILMESLGVSEMGHKTDAKMGEIGKHYADKTLDATQKTIVDTYSGVLDNNKIVIKDKTGVERSIVMRQGNEKNFGTKHSLFRHYGTNTGVINADDIALIPKVLEEGKRTEKANKKVDYVLKIGKVTYTVYTRKDGNGEVFYDFYSSWRVKNKAESSMPTFTSKGGNTQLSARTKDASALSADKGSNNLGESNTRFRITPKMDAEYMEAVEAGDMETAQRMVDEAAAAAGYNMAGYHGTPNEFNTFEHRRAANGKIWGDGFYFAESEREAKQWGDNARRGGQTTRVISAYLSVHNPVEVMSEDGSYVTGLDSYVVEQILNQLDPEYDADIIEAFDTGYLEDFNGEKDERIGDIIKDLGYDAVIGSYYGDSHIMVFNPSQIKSADPVTYDDNGNVVPLSERFNPENEDIRFRMSNENQAIFVSNAAKAVEGIKMEKATPEQWLKMLEKAGGLKAGEDKWMGLSDFLKASDKKTLTKQEVLDFINENMIVIEEQHYEEDALDKEALWYKYEESEEGVDAINYQMQLDAEAYAERELADSDLEGEEWEQEYERLVSDYIEDDLFGSARSAAKDAVRDLWMEEEAPKLMKGASREINSTRINYTTTGLDDLHEIALTVPTIESWNEGDEIHFGDAGEGRAVAWIRFGETTTGLESNGMHMRSRKLADELEKKYGSMWNSDETYEQMSEEDKAKRDEADRLYHLSDVDAEWIENKRQFANRMAERGYTEAAERERREADEAERLWSEYRAESSSKKVLVIDEIQSKRHQEGREKGYRPKDTTGYWKRRTNYLVAKTEYEGFFDKMEQKYGDAFSNAVSEEDFRKVMTEDEFRQMSIVKEKFDKTSEEYIPTRNAIPDAPFDKNWHELAMKRMLRYAAENGYDVIAWTKGKQQAERYSIGKVISGIAKREAKNDGMHRFEIRSYAPSAPRFITADGEGKIIDAINNDAEEMQDYIGKNLSEVFGKDLAQQMLDASEKTYISEEELVIGAEGMKGFYDKMLPAFMNKYGKKWGVKVEDIELPNLEEAGHTMHSVPVTEEMKASVMEGQVMFRVRGENESAEEFVDSIIEDFKSRYNAFNDIFALDPTSKEQLAEFVGIPVDALSDEMAANILKRIEERDSRGWFNPDTKRIAIFVREDVTDSKKSELVLIHENIHAINRKHPELIAIGEYLWNNAKEGTREYKYKTEITKAYPESEWFDEMSSYVVSEYMQDEEIDKLKNLLDAEHNELLNKLLNKSGYGKDRKQRPRVSWNVLRERPSDRSEELRSEGGAAQSGRAGTPGMEFGEVQMRNRNVDDRQRPKVTWTRELTAEERRRVNEILPGTFSEKANDAQSDNTGEYSEGEGDIRFSIRTKPAPEHVETAYKLFNVDENGNPHALFIDGANALGVGVWYDADSPLVKDLEKLEPGFTYLVDKDGNAEQKQYKNKQKSPSKAEVEEATANGSRYILVGQYANGKKSYHNWGINGSGQVSKFAMRPGWHLTDSPSARHIGEERNPEKKEEAMYRRPNQRWFKVEYAADVDYNEEAASNPTKDIQTHIPEDGYYSFKTNTNANDVNQNWIISGSIRIVKPLSREEVRRLNEENGVPDDLDYRDDVSFRVTGTPTEDVVAEGVSLSPAQLASLAGDIFAALPEDVRKKITDGLNGNILGLQDAILQIPASLATKEEWNDEDRQMAEVVAEQITKAVGKEMTRPFSASEALWTLYNAVNKSTDLVSEASRALVRRNLGFDSQALEMEKEARDGVRFRTVGDASANAQASMYNRGAANVRTRLKESFVDMHASVEKLVKAIEKKSGKVAQGFENILMALNQQSSKGLAAMEAYQQKFLNKMFAEIREIMDKTDFKYEDIVRYVILKHGLERNIKLAQRDARAHYQEIYDDIIAKIKGMNPAQKRTYLTNAQLRDADAKAELARLQAVNVSALAPDQLAQYKKDIAKAKKEADEAAEHLARAKKIASMTEQDAQDELDKIFDNINNESDSVYKEMRKNDYSGISSMFYDTLGVDRKKYATEEEYQAALMQAKADKYDTLGDIEGAAQMEVDLFEKTINTDKLWKSINNATKETLRQQYEANMISKDQYDNLRGMFEFYVPLRGFKDNTAEDMYTYYRRPNSTGYTKPILGAEGRKTEAESPFGWIASMAGSAIASNVKNEAKLALYYFVANRPDNGVASLSRTWFVHTPGDVDASGKKIFRPAYPPFNEDLSTDAAKQAYEDWQEQMRDLQKQGLAYEAGQRLNLGNSVVNISDANKPEHIVNVKVGGKDYTIVINGNPRAAQAINGDLNIEATAQDYSAVFGPMLRWMSSVNTSYNPEFWITNMMRDVAFTLMAVNIKEDPAYRRKFYKNYAKAFKVISMVAKNEKGTLGNKYIENMYKDFVKYGGVTGYTQIKDSETWEKEIENYLASNDPSSLRNGKIMRGMKSFFHGAHRFGESLEQVSRFAAFLTARETGKPISEAINDAKEITVNFNRKGSGRMITLEEAKRLTGKNGRPLSKLEQWAVVGLSSIAPLGRRAIMFFNAAIQGLNATYKLYAKNKTRAIGWALGYAAVGMINAVLHSMFDDDDDYLDIPQYERRNSLMIGWNGAYVKWALPQEARAFYALGDLAVESVMGRNPHQSVLGEALKISTEILPINPTEGWKAFMPSVAIPFVELALNEDYKGAPIYNEQKWLSEEERKRSAKWSKAYSGTGDLYIGIAKVLNAVTGGDEHDAGLANIQPEKIEHLVQSAFGGTVRTADKLVNTIMAAIDPEEDVTVRQMPFLNRFLTINDERFKNVHVNDVYDYYSAEAEHAISLQKKYTKDRDADALRDLRSSDEYKWARIYSRYKKPIKNFQEKIKAAEGTAERMELMKRQDELKRKMIKEISEL